MTATILNILVALALVLLLIVGLGILARRLSPTLGRPGALLRVHASLGLGGRERVLLVQAGEDYLLLGVSPGRVQTLHQLERAATAELLQSQGNGHGHGAAFASILQNLAGKP